MRFKLISTVHRFTLTLSILQYWYYIGLSYNSFEYAMRKCIVAQHAWSHYNLPCKTHRVALNCFLPSSPTNYPNPALKLCWVTGQIQAPGPLAALTIILAAIRSLYTWSYGCIYGPESGSNTCQPSNGMHVVCRVHTCLNGYLKH